MKRKFLKSFALSVSMMLLVSFLFVSCEKEPGEGGNSTIYGKVMVKEYNTFFTYYYGEYPGADEYVYIIYGDDRSYSDRVKTNYNGEFEFKYLRPGNYKLYVYSKDSTMTSVSGDTSVVVNVEITDKKQEVEVPTITIYN